MSEPGPARPYAAEPTTLASRMLGGSATGLLERGARRVDAGMEGTVVGGQPGELLGRRRRAADQIGQARAERLGDGVEAADRQVLAAEFDVRDRERM